MATYELFQQVKKKPPLGGKRDIKRFTQDVSTRNVSGDLTKGGNIGSGSVLLQNQQEWREERGLKHTNSQSVLDNHHLSGSVAYSLLLPTVTGQPSAPQNFSTAYNPLHASSGVHDPDTMLYKFEKRVQKGNRSRDAQSWVGGTAPHDIRPQRVPLYQGFQPGVKAENVHGKTFAKVSSTAI